MSSRSIQLLLLGVLSTALSKAQERFTVQSGPWNESTTWSEGIIPSAENSNSVSVAHAVTIPGESSVSIDGLVIMGSLVVDPYAELHIVNGDSIDLALTPEGTLDVHGMLVGYDGVEFDGMTELNSGFYAGSVYRHLAAKEGNVPVALWDQNSTIELRNFNGGAYMTSPNWSQTFGNVVYNCPEQGAFVEFNGRLRRIAGNLTITNTNNNILRLSGSQESSLEVSGNIVIEGPSEVWFSTSGDCSVLVGGDFQYRSASLASSYFATTGQADVSVQGDFVLDAEHRLKMASSTSTGHTNLVLAGDSHFLKGKLDALGTGTGTIIFAGSEAQHVFASPGANTFEGNISFKVEPDADVDLHQSLITNTTGGDLIVEGTIRLGSVNESGMIQAGDEGNIHIAGSIVFGEGSRIVLNGAQTQHITYPDWNTNVESDNPSAIVLHTDAQFGSLAIRQGSFLGASHAIRLRGNLSRDVPGKIEHEGTLVLNGIDEQILDLRGDTLDHILVEQEVAGTVTMASLLYVSGALTIQSEGSGVISNGNLVLLSSSESAGSTASIGRLPAGSGILGTVTIQRFIRGAAGDYYRYISSAVTDATVASLMDDVAVTGTFDDADTGSGLPENTPSLFYYNEEVAGWEPYPTSGTSSANSFEPGVGYCFFNWNEAVDTYWDVTGNINQGTLVFDLTYTPGNSELTGWNLIGNPYPSSVRWGETGWDAGNVSTSVAVRDYQSGGFLYSDGQTGSLPDGLIAAGQAFWVRSTGPDPTLRIDEDAKASDGATYHRMRSPDYLEMTVSVRKHHDRAYLRIRERSHEGFDSFDAPKLRNDSLSLSFRTSDNVNVAIDAVPELPCFSEIPLTIEGSDGSSDLHFTIRSEGIVRASTFAIRDTTTGRRFDFDELGRATIDGNVNQSALRLVITSATTRQATARAADVVCSGDTLVIELEGGQQGVRYYLERAGHQFWPLAISDTRKLFFLADSLPDMENTYDLMGGSACSGHTWIDSVVVLKPLVAAPVVGDGFHCGPGAVELQATPSAGHKVIWFAATADSIPVGSAAVFTTPVLRKSATYFASAMDEHGCESRRIQVTADIRPPVSVSIESREGYLLAVSETGMNYQWYLNDSLLHDEQDNRIAYERPGLYKVVAVGQGCSAVDVFDPTVTGLNEEVRAIAAFPIPCRDFLRVTYPDDFHVVSVYTISGIPVVNVEVQNEDGGCLIDLSRVPAGDYLVRILGKINPVTLRVVKVE